MAGAVAGVGVGFGLSCSIVVASKWLSRLMRRRITLFKSPKKLLLPPRIDAWRCELPRMCL